MINFTRLLDVGVLQQERQLSILIVIITIVGGDGVGSIVTKSSCNSYGSLFPPASDSTANLPTCISMKYFVSIQAPGTSRSKEYTSSNS